VKKSARVRVSGPLVPFVEGFAMELSAQGYVDESIAGHLRLAAHLSRWIAQRAIGPEQVTGYVVEHFVAARRCTHRLYRSQEGLNPLLQHLRSQGVVPLAAPSEAPSNELLVEYDRYLVEERPVKPQRRTAYVTVASEFLEGREVARLASADVTTFVRAHRDRPDLLELLTALRSALRFLFLRGYVPTNLVHAVPAASQRRLVSLPKVLDEAEVGAVLATCDRRTTLGRRNYAALLLMVRLGLRAGEVAALTLDDIDWEAGEMAVRGKGGSAGRLPLPADVGEAIVSYLRRRWSAQLETRSLFLRNRAPYREGTTGMFVALAGRALRAAGVPSGGAHRLRHTAATEMLRRGATLTEIAQVLRHRHIDTTAIYAKVDRNRLRTLASRRALGFQLERAHKLLPRFVDYIADKSHSFITTKAALAWAMLPRNVRPSWWATRLVIVRGFARYMQTLDPRTEVPPVELLPHRCMRSQPYVYTADDIVALLAAAQARPRPLLAATYTTLVGLLAVTGMRMGEAIALDDDDVDLRSGVLTIRKGKFDKTREIPVHATTVDALASYRKKRRRRAPPRNEPSFFVSTAGTRLFQQNVDEQFIKLVFAVGLDRRRPRPHIHDLRHTFAIRTVIAWHRAEEDVEAQLPLLSTYLGHIGPSSTYWYLSAVPELLEVATARLERALMKASH